MMIALARAMEGADFGADGQFSEFLVVPGIGAREWPPAGGLKWCGCAFRCNLSVAAELVQLLVRRSRSPLRAGSR